MEKEEKDRKWESMRERDRQRQIALISKLRKYTELLIISNCSISMGFLSKHAIWEIDKTDRQRQIHQIIVTERQREADRLIQVLVRLREREREKERQRFMEMLAMFVAFLVTFLSWSCYKANTLLQLRWHGRCWILVSKILFLKFKKQNIWKG